MAFPDVLTIREAPRFDPGIPHPARVYAVWLGGKDHFPADRRAAEEVAACRPQVVAGAVANRAFLARVVRYLAGSCGVRQFLDVGPGLPAPGATHAVAQAVVPESKIVYVDSDPLVLAHARALLTSTAKGHASTSAPTCATPGPSSQKRPRSWTSPGPPP